MDIKEQVAIKFKGFMPQVILDYVNNNEVVKMQDCELMADQIIPLVRADMRACFLKYLTVDSDTHDRRRKDYNQAIFDDEKGFAVFNGTDLDMVMDKFDLALKSFKEGE